MSKKAIQPPPVPQPPQMSMADLISQTSHQVLLFSSQGKATKREVGGQLPDVPHEAPNNGQTKSSSATLNDVGVCEYDFLNIEATQGNDLYGTIIECDIDYSFYNTRHRYNNAIFLSFGPLDANNNPEPGSVGPFPAFVESGVWTPLQYAEQLANTLNGAYDLVNPAVNPFTVEYNQPKRRFIFKMEATTPPIDLRIYDKWPMPQNGSPEFTDGQLITAHKAMGLVRNTGQTVPNFYTRKEDRDYGPIGYWIVPNDSEFVSPATVDLRLTDAIQVSTRFDSRSRNSNRVNQEATNIVTAVSVPAILQADEQIPSTLTFKPTDFSYRSTFRINASNVTNLTFELTDLRGNTIEMLGGNYTIRCMIYQLPSINYAMMETQANTMEQYLASIPQFSKKTAGGERIAKVVPPKNWLQRLKKITLAELKHKYLE